MVRPAQSALAFGFAFLLFRGKEQEREITNCSCHAVRYQLARDRQPSREGSWAGLSRNAIRMAVDEGGARAAFAPLIGALDHMSKLSHDGRRVAKKQFGGSGAFFLTAWNPEAILVGNERCPSSLQARPSRAIPSIGRRDSSCGRTSRARDPHGRRPDGTPVECRVRSHACVTGVGPSGSLGG